MRYAEIPPVPTPTPDPEPDEPEPDEPAGPVDRGRWLPWVIH